MGENLLLTQEEKSKFCSIKCRKELKVFMDVNMDKKKGISYIKLNLLLIMHFKISQKKIH
jgi:hypothetical protein